MNSMNYIGKFISNFRDFYNEINAATLTGAIDVVVVEQPDGSFTCSPFHVRFGKLGVLRSREKIVDIEINGEPLNIHMKLGDSGEAFFVEEVYPNEEGDEEVIPPHLACSPIPSHDQIESWMIDAEKAQYGIQWKNNGGNDEIITKNDKNNNNSSNKISVNTVTTSAKVFVAETIADQDKVRKISIAAADFITIENQENKEKKNNVAICDSQTSADEKDGGGGVGEEKKSSEENKENTENNLSSNSSSASLNQSQFSTGEKQQNGKRKRRKKSHFKKKSSISGNNSNISSNNNNNNNNNSISGGSTNGGNADNKKVQPLVVDDDDEDDDDDNREYPAMFSMCDVVSKDMSKRSRDAQVCISTETVQDGKNSSSNFTVNIKSCSNDSLNDLAKIPLNSEHDFHFFSDTELTPGCSPESRPCSPIVSDTEIEQRRHEEESVSDASVVSQSWKWGELPSPLPRSQQVSSTKMKAPLEPTDQEAVKKQQQEEAQKSMLSGMFSFMKKTKHLRQDQTEGIYLSELNSEELDPEVAALYFPHSYRGETKSGHNEEDAESGNGPSIPHSPNSQSPHTIGSGNDLTNLSLWAEVSISLCGNLETGLSDELFNQFIVSYDDFVNNPMVIENPDLVVRIDGKYYNWRTACPLIMSLALYKKPLPQPVIELLSNEFMPPQQNKKDKVEVAENTRSYSWFNWRRFSESKNKKVQDLKTVDEVFAMKEENTYAAEPEMAIPAIDEKDGKDDKEDEKEEEKDEKNEKEEEKDEKNEKEEEKDGKYEKEEKEEGYAGSNSSEDSDGGQTKTGTKVSMERRYYQSRDKCRKTLRLSSEQIASLNLKDGANEVVFSVTTAYQGTSRCKCHIYKWKHDDRIVISDIDGTITKSDVLGHILPIVGKDWAQSGVAQLFTKIKNNGYKLLYLSARAIGQARVTRDYLKSIKQGDLSLPEGPLLLNPTSLISAFHREVIEKKPEEFKISCLRDIAALFPPDVKPFYAGYGNRVNDVWAYRAVGIPIVRIFTINYKGELKHELTQTFQSSYMNMCHLVDEMFPPPPEELPEDFSNFIFWRDPIPELDVTSFSIPSENKNNGKSKKF
ncbi:hypothetical protein Phum_PHUM407130 [Pediculus humanus corporis]|uniref:phosphatidate phosphatase n=1 Tax=Pediculus humanus subsp. corporis TaxID=121224 RepID=E0VRY2_PEDHC|nr:uncharacterized protein Phum_PHUM407130 [Pediculus humanus corporis]EEB16138.1 hypothetical protein Phum_PHUM407130 [Pediculus humanus corporis]